MYGICFPKIKVQYILNYFHVLNKRITIDNQITYLSLKNDFKIRDESLMLEIKYKDKEDNKIFTKLADQTIRFSKYCRGIEFLNLL